MTLWQRRSLHFQRKQGLLLFMFIIISTMNLFDSTDSNGEVEEKPIILNETASLGKNLLAGGQSDQLSERIVVVDPFDVDEDLSKNSAFPPNDSSGQSGQNRMMDERDESLYEIEDTSYQSESVEVEDHESLTENTAGSEKLGLDNISLEGFPVNTSSSIPALSQELVQMNANETEEKSSSTTISKGVSNNFQSNNIGGNSSTVTEKDEASPLIHPKNDSKVVTMNKTTMVYGDQGDDKTVETNGTSSKDTMSSKNTAGNIPNNRDYHHAPLCRVWGQHSQRLKSPDLSILYLLFQDITLDENNSFSTFIQDQLVQYQDRKIKTTGEDSTLKKSQSEHFVNIPDDINKFFEQVDSSEEFDDTTPAQEMLMSGRIVMKRICQGLRHAKVWTLQTFQTCAIKVKDRLPKITEQWNSVRQKAVNSIGSFWDKVQQFGSIIFEIIDGIGGGRDDEIEFERLEIATIRSKVGEHEAQ